MKLTIEKSVIVVTPTIGSPKLADAIESVQRQTYGNLEHLVVVDGALEYGFKAREVIEEVGDKNPGLINKHIRFIDLPYNTGKTGGSFYGHRIYAAISHLLNADYIFFLDEDNWYDPEHISSLVEVLDRGNDFAYSFRKVFRPDKTYVCDDNCEALGKWPIYFTHHDHQYLIDTSAFAFNTKFLQKTGHHWHHGWGGDRYYFYNALSYKPKWDTNYKHTLCYRLDGNSGSVNDKFFIEGNKVQLEHYNGELPWLKI